MSEYDFDLKRFSKMEVLKIVEILGMLAEECEKRGIKFSQFDKEDLWNFFMAYRAYKLSGEPPF